MSSPLHNNAFSGSVRLGTAEIKGAWALFAAQPGAWLGAEMLCFVLCTGFWLLLAVPLGLLAPLQLVYTTIYLHRPAPPMLPVSPFREFAEPQALGILTVGVSAVFSAGLLHMALRQKRGETVAVFDLFSGVPRGLPLFLLGALIPALTALLTAALKWPLHRLLPLSDTAAGNVMLGVSTLLNGAWMFAPLLILDAGASVPDALRGSVRLLRGQVLRGMFFYAIVSLLSVLGFVGCGVGMLATYPLLPLSIALAYLALTPQAAPPAGFDPAPEGVWPPPPRIL